jgi:hypothetical protein
MKFHLNIARVEETRIIRFRSRTSRVENKWKIAFAVECFLCGEGKQPRKTPATIAARKNHSLEKIENDDSWKNYFNNVSTFFHTKETAH